MSAPRTAAFALTFIAAAQVVVNALVGPVFDRLFPIFRRAQIGSDPADELGHRKKLEGSGQAEQLAATVDKVAILTSGVVAALSADLAVLAASAASLVIAALATDGPLVWAAAGLTGLALAAFAGLALPASRGKIVASTFRLGRGGREIVGHGPRTLPFHRNVATLLGCLVVVESLLLTV